MDRLGNREKRESSGFCSRGGSNGDSGVGGNRELNRR